jgi:hypothetical protein
MDIKIREYIDTKLYDYIDYFQLIGESLDFVKFLYKDFKDFAIKDFDRLR